MAALFKALPAILATARWWHLDRDGALALLLGIVWGIDTARAQIGVPSTLPAWALTDVLWLAQFQAHVLVLRRGGATHLAGGSSVYTAGMAMAYALHWRHLGPTSPRHTWLMLAGTGWSLWGVREWRRQPRSMGSYLGTISAALAVLQCLHLAPARLVAIPPLVFYVVASATLIYGLRPVMGGAQARS